MIIQMLFNLYLWLPVINLTIWFLLVSKLLDQLYKATGVVNIIMYISVYYIHSWVKVFYIFVLHNWPLCLWIKVCIRTHVLCTSVTDL